MQFFLVDRDFKRKLKSGEVVCKVQALTTDTDVDIWLKSR